MLLHWGNKLKSGEGVGGDQWPLNSLKVNTNICLKKNKNKKTCSTANFSFLKVIFKFWPEISLEFSPKGRVNAHIHIVAEQLAFECRYAILAIECIYHKFHNRTFFCVSFRSRPWLIEYSSFFVQNWSISNK